MSAQYMFRNETGYSAMLYYKWSFELVSVSLSPPFWANLIAPYMANPHHGLE